MSHPDGTATLVTDGIQRLRYRLSLKQPVFVKKNTAYQISIDAGVTSYVFMPDHAIRLEVSSSNFPRFDRNLNSVPSRCRRTAADESKADHLPREGLSIGVDLTRHIAPWLKAHRSSDRRYEECCVCFSGQAMIDRIARQHSS